MTEFPGFYMKDASGKQEKLIAELLRDLDETTKIFMKLNHPGTINQEIFCILRDAAIGYCGGILLDLSKLIADKNQIPLFVNESRGMFNAYLDLIEKRAMQVR